MKKTSKVLVSIILILALSTTLSASSLIREVTGKENKGITVKYNNQVQNLKDGHGEAVYPVIIDGSTYLPVRAIADMMGASIIWDGTTKTISIQGNSAQIDDAVPTDLPSSNDDISSKASKPVSNKSNNMSKNLGTKDDPVELGTTYFYENIDKYKESTLTNNYEVTINKVKAITRDEIELLGFKKPEKNSLVDYVMVTVELKADNTTYKGDDFVYLNMYKPYFSGSATKDGLSITGATDYGFVGSLSKSVAEATGYTKIFPGDSYDYSATGKILLPIYKQTENYLVISNLDFDTEIYFELQ